MNSGDKFHLIIASILFVGLFSFTMLPPPLNGLGHFIQGAGYTVFEIAKITGSATNQGMCVLADLWNMGGLVAEYSPKNGGALKNESCALMEEKKLAITPKDEARYGAELKGVVQKVYILDKIALNKLFFVSYALLGLVLAAMIADFWLATRGRKSTGMAVGITVMLTIGVVMTVFRSGLIWPYLVIFTQLTPGNTLLGDGIFMVLILSTIWWLFAQIIHGFNVSKANYKKFAAVGKAAELDLRRGEKVIEAREGKL